jgi:hypothetical protein
LDYVSKEDGDKMINCLLFIDDARSWERFADEICSFRVITDDNQPFQRTLLNINIQEITKSPLASAAIIRIADNWVFKWKSVAEPPFTWSMPKAVIPNLPQVQEFLRSSEKQLIYPIEKRRHFLSFKEELNENNHLMRFSVSVSDWNKADGPNKGYCVLEKNKRIP